jgi:hypothetical protein
VQCKGERQVPDEGAFTLQRPENGPASSCNARKRSFLSSASNTADLRLHTYIYVYIRVQECISRHFVIRMFKTLAESFLEIGNVPFSGLSILRSSVLLRF